MIEPKPSIPGCKMCGKCCRFSWWHCLVKNGDFDHEKLALLQGGIDLGYAIMWDHPCRYLDLETNRCKIHDDQFRPDCCREFGPGNGFYHPDGCAFQNFNHDSCDWELRNSGAWKGQVEEK